MAKSGDLQLGVFTFIKNMKWLFINKEEYYNTMDIINENLEPDEYTEEEVDAIIDYEDTSAGNVLITHPFSPSEIELISPSMNLGDLIDMLAHGEINLDTDFQREGNLWEIQKQSRLIESVLLGLRLPAFYFEKVEKKKWDIIDGLQRCWAIKNFCIDQSFSLTGLEFLKEFEGKLFLKLDYDFQREIRRSQITVNLLTIGVQKRAKYILFQRLNTGGVELTPQEVRNAVFQGVAIDTVKKMAKSVAFKYATGDRIPTKRKQDEDFVSRFIAFYLTDFNQYYPDLDTFINDNMEVLANRDLNTRDILVSDFYRAMDLSFVIFGNDAFRKRNEKYASRKPINKAYFEVIAVNFSKLNNNEIESLKVNQELLKDNLIILMKNNRYWNSLSAGTGKKDSVTIRFSWFQETMRKSINGQVIRITDDYKIENSEL